MINYVQIISNYVEITRRLDAVDDRDCYKEKKGSVEKPAHAHLRRVNIMNNYVNIIGIMYFWLK